MNIVIAGYRYPEVLGSLAPLAGESDAAFRKILKKASESSVGMREAILAGREAHFRPKDTTDWGDTVREYAFKADVSAAGKKAAKALHRQNPTRYPANGPRDVIGVCKMGRLSDSGSLEDVRELVLNGLDEGHVVDRLISEMVRWHAEVFGEGPHSPAGAARRAAQALDASFASSLPSASAARRRARV